MALNINSFSNVCYHLLKYVPHFSTFSSSSLANLKRFYQSDFNQVLEFCISQDSFLPDTDLTMATMGKALFTCFSNTPTDKIRNSIYDLLLFICENNPRYGKFNSLDNSSLQKLICIRDKIRESFNPDVGLPDNIVNTVNSRSTSNSLANAALNEENSLLSQLIDAINNLSKQSQDNNEVNTIHKIPHEYIKKVKIIYQRILRKQNHIAINKFHLEQGTTPSQLFFKNFPIPFLSHNENAVNDHNEIIREAQKKIMNSNIKHLQDSINSLENNLQSIKNELNSNNFNTSKFFGEIKDEVEKDLKKEFDRAHEKATRHAAKPFLVRNNTNSREKQSTTSSHYNGSIPNHNKIYFEKPHSSRYRNRHSNNHQSSFNRSHSRRSSLRRSSQSRSRSRSSFRTNSNKQPQYFQHYSTRLNHDSNSRHFNTNRVNNSFYQHYHSHPQSSSRVSFSNSASNYQPSNFKRNPNGVTLNNLNYNRENRKPSYDNFSNSSSTATIIQNQRLNDYNPLNFRQDRHFSSRI